MAAEGTEATLEGSDSPAEGPFQEPGSNTPKRHARVTVKYNRKELQRRLDLEKWIDMSLDRLYSGQVGGGQRPDLLLQMLHLFVNSSLRVSNR